MSNMTRIEKKKHKKVSELKDFTSWMTRGLYPKRYSCTDFQNTRYLELKDGTTLSIQASGGHYCEPREILPYSDYTEFEIGFPNRPINQLKKYAECHEDYTETVYPYVPKVIIEMVVYKSGGVVGFKSYKSFKYIKTKRNGKVYFQKVLEK